MMRLEEGRACVPHRDFEHVVSLQTLYKNGIKASAELYNSVLWLVITL